MKQMSTVGGRLDGPYGLTVSIDWPVELREAAQGAAHSVAQGAALPARYGTAFHVKVPVAISAALPVPARQTRAFDWAGWSHLSEQDRRQIGNIFRGEDAYLHWQIARAEDLCTRLLVVPDGAVAKIVDTDAGSALKFVVLGEGAKLEMYSTSVGPSMAVRRLFVWQKARSQFTFWVLRAETKFLSEGVETFLDGEGAEARIVHLCLGGDAQQYDMSVSARHRAPRTQSNVSVRMSGFGRFAGVYRGLIDVAEQAAGTIGYQSGQTLSLARQAVLDILPKLEIRTNDVRCSHGVTTSHLDDLSLFYLRARGIGGEEARRLSVSGFFQKGLDIPQLLAQELSRRLENYG